MDLGNVWLRRFIIVSGVVLASFMLAQLFMNFLGLPQFILISGEELSLTGVFSVGFASVLGGTVGKRGLL